MKLILKEYLSSLKERDELDAILPDLLSTLGLSVFSKPGKGTRQYGVDVAAYGSLNGGDETVYLFSIKAGDITRNSWNGDAHQALRPSLDEIIDTYIPNRIPNQYKNKPIAICLCFGGYIQEQVRDMVEGYINRNSAKGLSFEEWNGDKLAKLILQSFLREELLPKKQQSLLRKSLALIDEPDISFKHYANLISILADTDKKTAKQKLMILRQLNICLWILYSWSRDASNLESAYLSAERTLLYSWDISSKYLDKKYKQAKEIIITFHSIQSLYRQICNDFVRKILPHTSKLHGLSSAVQGPDKVDINFKMFDLLGRISLNGIWSYWYLSISAEVEQKAILREDVQLHFRLLKEMIVNNPILYCPYKDNQVVDVSLASWLLFIDPQYHDDVHNWLLNLIRSAGFSYKTDGKYPIIGNDYYKHLNHPPKKSTKEYKEDATSASVLYPTIAALSAVAQFEDIYTEIQAFKKECLEHCTFQFWYPDETSEERFYTNVDIHGAALTNIPIEKSSTEFLSEIFRECDETTHFDELSPIKFGIIPLILVACRHYRLPMPVHFIKMLKRSC